MRRLIVLSMLIGISGCAATPARRGNAGAEPPTNVADPEFLAQYARTRRFSLGKPRSIKFVPDGSAALFLRASSPDSFVQNLYEWDTESGEERVLLTAEQILSGAEESLSVDELARRERMRMSARGIASYQLSEDGQRILVPLSGRLFVVEREGGKVRELLSEGGYPLDPRFSEDAAKVACVRDGELYVIDVVSGTERKLTTGAGGSITNGLSEFVAQEEMGRFAGYWWSPDGAHLAYQQTDISDVETMHIMDAMYPDRGPHTWPYPRPGKANAKVKLGVIPVGGGDTVWVNWDRDVYPYLATVRWSKNAPLTVLVQNREQTDAILLSVDPATGATTTLLTEHDDAWINLDQRMPHWLADGSAFLWTTERNGRWQLELRDRTGGFVAPLTDVDFGLKGFVSLDDTARVAYVSGGDDPTQTHVYRVPLDDAPRTPLRLTMDRGSHGLAFSKNHAVYLHTASTADGRQWQSIHRADDGGEIGTLRSLAETPPFIPRLEQATVGRGRSFHAALIRPKNFESGRKYPVIVSVYGGPHAQTVGATPDRYLLQQWIADHGFIVVSIDGRGTPARGRDWERAIKGNLIELPLADQVAGLQALGKKYAELDLTRVGIYGWSFGGYFSAMAVMQRPDVFHVAVAGAPVCAWEDYDTHYTERYMGLPDQNAVGYADASVLTHCKDLARPLMIIHGTADDNVYFAHALKMSNELFRSGRKHDFLPLSGFTHMVADPLVTTRLYDRIVDYFVEHLQRR